MMAASPRVYLLQEFLTFGDGDASLEDARGAAVVELLPISKQDERLGAPRQPPSRGCLGLSRGYLGLGRVVDLDGGLMQVS